MPKTMESDETKIAVLVEKVGTMSTVLTKLDTKFDTMTDRFATKEQTSILEKRVEVAEAKLEQQEGWKNKLAGAFIAVQLIWGVVLFYLTGHKP